MGGGLARGCSLLCLSRCSVEIIATRSSSHALVSSPFLSLLPVRHSSVVVGALGFFNLGRMGRARGRRVVCSDSNAGSDPFTPTVQSAAKIKVSGLWSSSSSSSSSHFSSPLDVDVLSRKGNLLELRCSSVLLCIWKPNALLTFARENFFGTVSTRADILWR